jgi:hypothetical protein
MAEASPRLSELRIIMAPAPPLAVDDIPAASVLLLVNCIPPFVPELASSAAELDALLLLVSIPFGLLDSPVGGTRVVTPGSRRPLSFLRADTIP